MNFKWTPWKIILFAGIMLLVSVLLPLLMVIQVVRSTLFLNFLAYALSFTGMIVGIIGVVFLARLNRNDDM